MPRYDYQCSAGHQYELQQPFGSPTRHKCHECGKMARRIVTVAPPLVFKAGGYYKSSGRDFAADTAGASESSASSESTGAKRSSTPAKAKSSDGAGSGSKAASGKGSTSKASTGKASTGKASTGKASTGKGSAGKAAGPSSAD